MPRSELIIRFTDKSKSFTYGVEYGRMLAKMEAGDHTVTNNGFPVRLENVDVLKATCEYYGYIAHFGRRYYKELIEFTAIKRNASDN